MPFETKNLSVLAYANGFTLWHYTTEEPEAVVNATGYFDGASDMVRKGDMVLATVDKDGANDGEILLVEAKDGGAVTMSKVST